MKKNNELKNIDLQFEKELNMPLRNHVLKASLVMEDAITNLLITYLNIDDGQKKLKALGNVSSSLSFHNKLSLLCDIGVLEATQMVKFNTVMEVRNKFMHVYVYNSFISACNEDSRKMLLRYTTLHNYDINKPNENLEENLESGFDELMLQCLDIIIEKEERKKKIIEDRRMALLSIIDYCKILIDTDTELRDKIYAYFNMPNVIKTKEAADLMNGISDIIHDSQTNMGKREDFNKLALEIENLGKTNAIDKIINGLNDVIFTS